MIVSSDEGNSRRTTWRWLGHLFCLAFCLALFPIGVPLPHAPVAQASVVQAATNAIDHGSMPCSPDRGQQTHPGCPTGTGCAIFSYAGEMLAPLQGAGLKRAPRSPTFLLGRDSVPPLHPPKRIVQDEPGSLRMPNRTSAARKEARRSSPGPPSRGDEPRRR